MKFEINVKDNVIVNMAELESSIECQSKTFLENILNYLKYSKYVNKDELINSINAYLKAGKEKVSLKQFIYQNNYKMLNLYSYGNESVEYLVLNDDKGIIIKVLKIADEEVLRNYVNQNYEALLNIPSLELYNILSSIDGEEMPLLPSDKIMYKKEMSDLKDKYNLYNENLYELNNNLFVLGTVMFRVREGRLDLINDPAPLRIATAEKLDNNFEEKIGSLDIQRFERVKSLVTKVYELDEKIDESGWDFIYLCVSKMIKDMIKAEQNSDLYFEKTGITYKDLVAFLEYFMKPLIDKYSSALENVDGAILNPIESELVIKYLNNKEYIIGNKGYTYSKKEHGVSVAIMIVELAMIAGLLVLFFSIDI